MKPLTLRTSLSSILFIICSTCTAWSQTDPDVVPNVDLGRYAGFWYEIAHAPNFFQSLCDRSTAKYEVLGSGRVSVLNTCIRNEKTFTTIEGVASVVNPGTPAKLLVDFGFLRRGDYWIVALDPDYNWAVVSGAGKKSLFILSRSAPMDPNLLNQLLESLNKNGFNTNNLIFDKYK